MSGCHWHILDVSEQAKFRFRPERDVKQGKKKQGAPHLQRPPWYPYRTGQCDMGKHRHGEWGEHAVQRHAADKQPLGDHGHHNKFKIGILSSVHKAKIYAQGETKLRNNNKSLHSTRGGRRNHWEEVFPLARPTGAKLDTLQRENLKYCTKVMPWTGHVTRARDGSCRQFIDGTQLSLT